MKILVAVDFSELGDRVVSKAKEISQRLSAKVFFLHVAEPDPGFVGFEVGPQSERDAVSAEYHREHQQIQRIAESSRADGLDATGLLVQGPFVEMILAEAKKLGVELIVMGSHGYGPVHRLLAGSVNEGVLHRAECPVLVVPTRGGG